MAADIILHDKSIQIVGGPLIARNETSSHGNALQASFRGPDNTRVEIRSGEITLQGSDGKSTGQAYFSRARLFGVKRIYCGQLKADEVESPAVTLGGGNPTEPGTNGRLTVSNNRGEITVDLNGESGAVYAGEPLQSLSDGRCKEDIKPLIGALEAIKQLRGVRFRWRDGDLAGPNQRCRIGMIAQEVKQVIPEIVEEREGHLTMSYAGLVPVLVDAINEQQLAIQDQSALLTAVERRLAALEAQPS